MNHYVSLTDAEILSLDGKCSPTVQEVIEKVKERLGIEAWLYGEDLTDVQRTLAAEILRAAEAKGEWNVTNREGHYCPSCKATSAYPLYKTGPNKGQPNTRKKQRLVWGASFNGTFLCVACSKVIRPILHKILQERDVKVALPQYYEIPTRYYRFDKTRCTKCQWEGHKGELGLLPAVMGGYYRGKCPSCNAESLPFGPKVFDYVPGFVMLPVADCPSETECRRLNARF